MIHEYKKNTDETITIAMFLIHRCEIPDMMQSHNLIMAVITLPLVIK